MNDYLVTAPRPVFDFEPGEQFAKELSALEEADLLAAGRVAIVPAEYQVVGTSNVHGAKPGEKFFAALRVDEEAALVAGGHVERLPKKAAKATNKEKK